MRKTKIICTIGPATNSEQKIVSLIQSGMNVARVNMSHGTNQEHIETIKKIKSARAYCKAPVGIMVDLKGPEIRIGAFATGKIVLRRGEKFIIDSSSKPGNESRVGISCEKLFGFLKIGQRLLLADGTIELVVESVKTSSAVCKVVCGGVLSNNKSINIPGLDIGLDYLSEVDKLDILMAISLSVDFLALSFVQSKNDIEEVKKFLKKHGGESIKLVAKIESKNGVKNMEEIIDAADGVMVARGDLGVEIDFVKLPHIQNKMLEVALKKHKFSITATQMLISMVKESRPTRAEITDISNAIISGSGAVMLSEETAIGTHPSLCVKTMAKIALESEKYISEINVPHGQRNNGFGGLCLASVSAAKKSKIKNIVVTTALGKSAEEISAYRTSSNILAFTPNEKCYYQMSILFGVLPIKMKIAKNSANLWNAVREIIVNEKIIKNDKVVFVSGEPTTMENSILEIKNI